MIIGENNGYKMLNISILARLIIFNAIICIVPYINRIIAVDKRMSFFYILAIHYFVNFTTEIFFESIHFKNNILTNSNISC